MIMLACGQAVPNDASHAAEAVGHMLRLVLEQHAVAARERADRARQTVVAQAFGLEAIQGIPGQ